MRVRLVAAGAVAVILALGLGIRMLGGGPGTFDGSGWLAQHAGTALYASMVYAGLFVAAPALRPTVAGAGAVAFCWAVELFQLTGVPAALSQRSVLARLALGTQFDASDLAVYPAGVLPLALLHHLWTVSRPGRAS